MYSGEIWWWECVCCNWVFFWNTNAIQNLYIGFCREFHRLSEYVVISFKMIFYNDNMPKIQCLTYFFQGDISAGTSISRRVSFINNDVIWRDYSLFNFKKSDKLLFVVCSVNFTLLLTLSCFNHTPITIAVVTLLGLECRWRIKFGSDDPINIQVHSAHRSPLLEPAQSGKKIALGSTE
jgi:hypothetical protein